MKKSFVHFLQNMIVLGLAVYLAQKLSNGQLFYYINQRFALLTLTGICLLTAMALVGINTLFVRPVQTDPNQAKGKVNLPFVFLFPVVFAILGLSWTISISMYLLVFILGLTRLNIIEEKTSSEKKIADGIPLSSIFFLLIPLILGVLVLPKPLSTSALDARGISFSAPMSIGSQTIKTMEIIPDDLTVLDWIRIFNYEEDISPYIGNKVNLIAFVYHDSRLDTNQFMAGRFVITCCVADAFAVGMAVNWPESSTLSDNSWVNIKGTIEVMEIEGERIPVIQASSVTQTEEPQQPYLYP